MADNQNLSAQIPIYDFATQTSQNPIAAPNVPNQITDGSLFVATSIQAKSAPNAIDVSKPLYGTTASDSLWDLGQAQKPALEQWNTDINQAYTQLNDGTYISRFDNYMSGVDNENRLALQQSTGEKWLNGVAKLGAKTIVNVVDATIGTVNGVKEGIEKGSLNAIYNNDFSKWIDDLNTRLDGSLPNYYTQQEKADSIASNILTSNFWADKVLGGMSFVTGTLISEAIWASATGGASLATIGGRGALKTAALTGFKNQNKILHSITTLADAYQRTVPASRALKAFNNARFLYTSAGYEAGVEARHFLKEARDNYTQSFQNTYGREPNPEEMTNFMNDAENGANGVFASNLALVGASNIAQFGSIFGATPFISTKGLQRGFMRTLGVGVERTVEAGVDTYKALNPTRVQRILGNTYNVFKSPIREGVIEEGGQSVFGNFAQRWLDSKYDPNAVQDNFSAIKAMGESIAQTYGTKQGQEEVLIGALIGGLSSARTGFNLGNYTKDVEQQVAFANWKTVNSDYNLTNKFFNASAQKSAREKVARNLGAEEGVLANQELNLSMFSKFHTDNIMGLLDNSAANYEASFNELNIQELAEQANMSVEEAEATKAEAITTYRTALQDYKDSQRVAEALIPDGEYLNIDNQNSFIPNADIQSMLALNIYMGKNSDRLAKAYAQSVSDTIGDKGTNPALQIENLLQDSQVNKSREVKKLTKELSQLDQALNKRNSELIKLAAKPRTEAGDTKLESFENRRQQLLAQEERDLERRNEINSELDGIAQQLNSVRKARNIANQDFITPFEEGTVTSEDLIATTQTLNGLSETLSAWRANGQVKAAEDVEYLIDQFDKAQKSFRYANDVYNKLSDPELRKREVKSIFSPFLSKAKKQGADITDYQKAQSELYGILLRQYNGLQQDLNSTLTPTEITEVVQQDNGDSLPPITQQTSAQKSAEQEVAKDFQQRRKELISQQEKELAELPQDNIEFEVRDIDGVEQYLKRIGEAPATIISKEEYDNQFSLENNQPVEDLINKHTQQQEELNNEEQAALAEVRNRFLQPTPENSTLKERLESVVNNILKNRKDVDMLATAMRRPSENEIEEYKKLYERNRKNKNGLRTPDQIRFTELQDIFNDYGRAVGTVENGTRLSDILEQLYTLENIEAQQETSLVVNNTNTEEVQARLSVAGEGVDTSNKTQYWEKSEFRVLEDGTYSITGINLQGLVDIINTSNNTIVLRDKTRKQVTQPLTGESYTPNDKFIIRFEDGEEIRVTIGATRNLQINPNAVITLNSRTRFKIIPSTDLGTNYQPLLQELNSNAEITPLEVVNTNFELEPGLSFTDFTNKQDDVEFSLFVSSRNEFNKNLLNKYRDGKIKLQEVVNTLAIYVMSSEGEVGGVMKSLSKQTSVETGNYAELTQIRNIAAQRAIESNLENELIDVQISVPFDKKGSYFGKPNFNLIYNRTSGVLATELLPLTDKAMQKIVDVGYITDGRPTLKENKKSAEKINTSFVKRLSAGRKLPIVVFNYNGSKIAYPVSMNEVQRDKVAEFDTILNSTVPVNERIKNLNDYLAQNNLNPNNPEIGFYYVAGETNIDDVTHIDRLRQQLSEENSYNDFTLWTEANSLEEAKRMAQLQSSINIDITDKPFHSPKLGLKLTQKTIIGREEIPSNTIVETVENINTQEIISDNSCG